MTTSGSHPGAVRPTRRRFLRLVGGASALAGGVSLLSACADDVVGADNALPPPTGTPTPTPTSSIPPTYTATDNDRLNFALQLHYLLAAYLQRALNDTVLPGGLTGGTGAVGAVTGGRRVAFADPLLAATVREVTGTTIAQLTFLRRTLGAAALAQPAINIGGGQGSPFQAIAAAPSTDPNATPPKSFFDPYASENDFLLGAVALFAVVSSAVNEVAWNMSATLRGSGGALAGGVASSNAIMRNALFVRADLGTPRPPEGEQTLFARASAMSAGRDFYDGRRGAWEGIGDFNGDWVDANITVDAGDQLARRRTPEQALGILYNSAPSASSGGFFPSGLNGLIRVSGANNL